MKWTDAKNGPSMLEEGSNGVFDRMSARTRELIRSSSSAESILENDSDDAFRWSKLSSSLDVPGTDAFVVGLDDEMDVSFEDTDVEGRMVVARERSWVDGDGRDADGANDATGRCRAQIIRNDATNRTNDDTTME
jgi:hypothetical protein